jgi:hypothetical protein
MEDASLYDLLIGEDGVDVNITFDTYTAIVLGVVLFLAISGALLLSGSLIKTL